MGPEVFGKQQCWKSAGRNDGGQSQKISCKLAVRHGDKAGQFARARLTVASLANMRRVRFISQDWYAGEKKKKTIAMPSSIKLVEKGPVISGWRVSLSRTSLPELSSHPQLSQFWREGTCSCSQLLPWGAVVAEPSTPARVPGAPSPFRDG